MTGWNKIILEECKTFLQPNKSVILIIIISTNSMQCRLCTIKNLTDNIFSFLFWISEGNITIWNLLDARF